MFKTSPIIGLGYKGYYENFAKFYPNPYRKKYDAHNIYITALANFGIIGFIPFIAIFFYPLKRSLGYLRGENYKTINSRSRKMAIICLTTLVPYMVSGWFSGGMLFSHIGMSLFYTNISLFMASDMVEDPSIIS